MVKTVPLGALVCERLFRLKSTGAGAQPGLRRPVELRVLRGSETLGFPGSPRLRRQSAGMPSRQLRFRQGVKQEESKGRGQRCTGRICGRCK